MYPSTTSKQTETSRPALPARIRSLGSMLADRIASLFRGRGNSVTVNLSSPPAVDRVSALLEVEARARAEGSNDNPPSSEEVIAGTQQEIVDYFRRLQDAARRKVERFEVRLSAAVMKVDVSEAIERLRDIPSRCENDVGRIAADFQSKLEFLRDREVHERRLIDAGQKQDEEDSESTGTSSRGIYLILMLAVTGAATLALGGKSVWGVNAEALLSTKWAITIAVIAGVFPYMVAAGVGRHHSHAYDSERPTFRAAVILTTVFTIVLAFFGGHLIHLTATGMVPAVADAIAAIATEPDAIKADFDAWKGFFLITIVGLLAFNFGNHTAGASAGVHGADEAYLRAGKVREQLTRQLRKRINETVDAAEKGIERKSARLRRRVRRLSRLVEKANDTQIQYRNFTASLEDSCNLLLEHYRAANAAARNSELPRSFSEHICFRLDGASEYAPFKDSLKRYEKIDSQLSEYSALIVDVRQKLRNLNQDAIQSLKAVDIPAIPDCAVETPQSAY